MTTRIKFYSGDPDGGMSKYFAMKFLAKRFHGVTVYSAVGGWDSSQGSVVDGPLEMEESLVFEVIADRQPDSVSVLAGTLAEILNQKTVLWTVDKVEHGFSEWRA